MSTFSFCKLGKRGTCLSARRRNMVDEWIVRNCASRVIERTRHEYCSNRAHVSSDMISGSIYKDQYRFGVNVEGDIPIVNCLVREYEERDTEAASFHVSPARGNQALFQRRMACQRQRIERMDACSIHKTARRLFHIPKIPTNGTKQVGIVEHCRNRIVRD